MSGHSHWANIQHKKGAVDNKRGKLWSKLSRIIIIAARNGGGDPGMNLKLRYAIDKARSVSMPKDNIERAVKKGTGDIEGTILEELTYEGFGPGGTAVLVEVVTDSRNRTNGEIRKIFERGGGNMGSSGCAAHFFERKGVFLVPSAGQDEEYLMNIALEAGADDMQRDGENFRITCDTVSFSKVQDVLEEKKISLALKEITQLPKLSVDADANLSRKVAKLLLLLDDHDDVQNVHCNANLDDAAMAEME
ncbi:MAG: YebC/PmpR family DNA-binding transcriptional regulator [Gemmataceae bacterium]|nr:YebC/PmpR family DNA-binding transcriptional regulator [Gemmataceae bacterium]